MTGLPQGWETISLEALGMARTSSIDPSLFPNERFELFSVPSYSNLAPEQPLGSEIGSTKQTVEPGDVMVCKIVPHINRVWVVPPRGEFRQIASSEWIVIRNAETEPMFLRWLMSAPDFRNEFLKDLSGIGGSLTRARPQTVAKIEIPLPPLPEQRRIVRKLDTLSARSTTARTHLTALEKLVERYKSGVLGLELSGVPLGNEADEQNTQPITNDNERGAWTFEALPTHWVWTGFKAFLENQTDSYRKLPQKDYQSEGEYPVIDQGADLIGGYSNDATLLLPAQPPYIIFGDHTRCVKFFEAPFVQGADGVKVFHAGKDVDIRFAYWALKGLQLPDKGYSRHAKFLKESYFPRPPIDEQREIVRRIEAAFAKIDRLKAEASAALKLLGHLDQRILAKAFAGDLVPQDPNDEPARDLLARIIEARATAPKGKRRRTVATD